jgi:serine/threonine protein kinase
MVAIKVFKGEVTSDGLPFDEMNACIQAGNHPHLVQILGKIKQHPQQKQGLVIALIPAVFKNLGNPPSFETCTRDTYPNHALLSVENMAKIIVGMAKAGAHLHERGLNHGDFYAHNIMVNPAYHSLLGDFGAATIYDKQSRFATQIEQLEVRAFGCLIEDLLTLTVDNVLTNDMIHAFSILKEDCLNPETIKRPTFSTICGQLERILDL